MTDITTTVDRYLAALNETDAERRRALVGRGLHGGRAATSTRS